MKPKTALQKQVVELSAGLPKITDKQKEWAYKQCNNNYFTSFKNSVFCLECGHKWNKPNNLNTDSVKTKTTCPSCKNKLINTLENKQFKEMNYFSILTVVNKFQVVRMMAVYKEMKKGQQAHSFLIEVMQHWIDDNGNVTTLSKSTNGFSMYFDAWVSSSELSLKPPVQDEATPYGRAFQRYNITPYKIYPQRKILPIIIRNGYKKELYDLAPHIFFSLILKDSFAETLLKSRQTELLKYYAEESKIKIINLWNTIKICIRKGYIVKDASIWIDYIDLLVKSGKDVRNSHFVCPDNLLLTHDEILEKFELTTNADAQLKYSIDKRLFFGLEFSKNELTVKVLENIKEFREEGKTHKHCVYKNSYFERENSLVLSARIGDTLLETVEVSLTSMKILQSRGKGNQATKHHKEIIDLVNNNLSLISSRMKKQKTKLSA